MKRTATIILALAIALSMTACEALDAILNVNLFSSMAAVKAADIEGADAGTLVELSASPSFYDTLAGDAALKSDVIDTIDAALPGAAPADEQELLVLAANIELQTTPAGDLINNIGSFLSDMIEGPEPVASEIEDLVRGILPDSVLGAGGVIDETAFLAMIAGLEDANDRYDLLGDTIVDKKYAPGAEIVAGDVAQSALVTALVVAIPLQAGFPTRGEYLYALLTEPTTLDPAGFTFPDMTLGTSLGNILSAAGIAFS